MDETPQPVPGTGGIALAAQLDDIAVHVVSDGRVSYPLDAVYPDASKQELDAGLAGRLDDQGALPLPYQCLLITTPTQKVLVDSGLGHHRLRDQDAKRH